MKSFLVTDKWIFPFHERDLDKNRTKTQDIEDERKVHPNATKNRNKIKQTNKIQWSQEKSWCKLENEDKSTNFAYCYSKGNWDEAVQL